MGPRRHRANLRGHSGGRRLKNAALFLHSRIVDDHVEHEAIELRLGQRVRAFLLDGILCRQHKQRTRQRIPHTADGHLILLHGFQEGTLDFRRGSVNLISQDDISENRPLFDRKSAILGAIDQSAD